MKYRDAGAGGGGGARGRFHIMNIILHINTVILVTFLTFRGVIPE
jgi:hypothetical protein